MNCTNNRRRKPRHGGDVTLHDVSDDDVGRPVFLFARGC